MADLSSTLDITPMSPPHHFHTFTPVSISLSVCEKCRDSLLNVFGHCLHHTPPIPSARELIEDAVEEHKKTTKKPPVFEEVKDPCIERQKKDVSFKTLEYEVQKDRAVRAMADAFSTKLKSTVHHSHGSTSQESEKKEGRGVKENGSEKDHTFFTTHLIPTSLLHARIQSHQSELTRLRSELYSLSTTSNSDKETIARLQNALKKSLEYCLKAGDWQDQESAAYKNVIKSLETEVSALMAYLLVSEDEKSKLRAQTDNAKKEKEETEGKNKELDKQVDRMKEKLHVAMKDYLLMNEKIEAMKKEAESGSEMARNRNEVLQKNLETLSKEYDVTRVGLMKSETRNRQLEFELDEMVTQFNSVNDTKLNLEVENKALKQNVKELTMKFQELEGEHTISLAQIRQLEDEIKEAAHTSTNMKHMLESRINAISSNFEELNAQKREVDGFLKQLKAENERYRTALKDMAAAREKADAEMKGMLAHYQTTIQKLELQNTKAMEQLEEEKHLVEKLTQTKERLLFEATDIRNSLEREQQNVAVLNQEVNLLKRQATESSALMNEQIEKLNTAKENLSNDKKILTESLKNVRTQLKLKDDELQKSKNELVAQRKKKDEEIKAIDKKLAESREQYQVQTVQLNDLQDKYRKQTDDLDKEVDLNRAQGKQIAELKSQLLALNDEYDRVEKQRKGLEGQRKELVVEKMALEEDKRRLEMNVAELETKMSHMKTEFLAVNTTKDGTIQDLTKQVYDFTEELKKQTQVRRYLLSKLEVIANDFKKTREALDEESSTRSLLEMQLDSMRLELSNERKMRIDFEKLQSKLERKSVEKEMETLNAVLRRNRKMTNVDATLRDELDRLTAITTILQQQ